MAKEILSQPTSPLVTSWALGLTLLNFISRILFVHFFLPDLDHGSSPNYWMSPSVLVENSGETFLYWDSACTTGNPTCWCPDLVFLFLSVNINLPFFIKLLLFPSCLEIYPCTACALCWLLGEYGGTSVLETLGASLPKHVSKQLTLLKSWISALSGWGAKCIIREN